MIPSGGPFAAFFVGGSRTRVLKMVHAGFPGVLGVHRILLECFCLTCV